uniref:Uncharacterized protein n=1 Tax=Romanomermis culicivorax TaxID=13658 RepID=A0A915JQV5_ROMCU
MIDRTTEVETSAQAEHEIHDDNEFAETVDVEAYALQMLNSDAEQLTDHSDDEEMLLDDAQKDSATQQQKRARFRIHWQSEFTRLEKLSNNE